jgi:uncharacterized protein YndB with AHSA1/START domain
MAKLKVVAEPSKHDILMTREFNAPRELVFRALTDPTLVMKWWGPAGMTTTIDTMDVRKGGLWRYIQRDAEGNEYGFHGVYHEITSPERMVYTFEWEGMPGHVLLETVSLTERDGKTILTDALIFQSVEDRDGMVQSGMEEGATQGWDRLEALLPDLKP